MIRYVLSLSLGGMCSFAILPPSTLEVGLRSADSM